MFLHAFVPFMPPILLLCSPPPNSPQPPPPRILESTFAIFVFTLGWALCFISRFICKSCVCVCVCVFSFLSLSEKVVAAIFILGFEKWFRDAVLGRRVTRALRKSEGWVLLRTPPPRPSVPALPPAPAISPTKSEGLKNCVLGGGRDRNWGTVSLDCCLGMIRWGDAILQL